MKLLIADNYDEMSRLGFEYVKSIVTNNPSAVLGLATGSTPVGMYSLMIKDCKENGTSYTSVKAVNLDEYVGLEKTHDQSYAYFMKHNLFDGIDINQDTAEIPNGMAKDVEVECARYSAVLEKYLQDVQVLGLGPNGHVGFNEPNTPFDSKTHLVHLTDSTISANARFFANKDSVPTKALTMGIAEIMKAKTLLLLASGKNKAQAVYDMLKGPVSESCPASVLQNHPNAIVIVDKEAASLLD